MSDQVLDPNVFNEMRELMDDALGAFINTYLDNSPKLIAHIDTGLASGDMDAVKHNAHQLKGGSGSIGAMHLFELAKQIEHQSGNGQPQGLDQLVSDLKAEYERVAEALKPYA